MLPALLLSCSNGAGNRSIIEGDTLHLRHAQNLCIVDYDDYTVATFRNPWDTTQILQTYVLVPSIEELPSQLPKGEIVRVPLCKSVVYTGIHANLFDELGHIDAIRGVCDAKYIINDKLQEKIAQGKVEDCGTPLAPNIEKIMMLNPDAIVLSAFEDSNDHNKVAQMGIPIIDCADYMERSPLAQAEWIKFYGRLFGEGEKADSLFDEIETAYMTTKEEAEQKGDKKKLLFDKIYQGSWSLPGSKSTLGILMSDAGACSAVGEIDRSGSKALAPEEVLFKGHDADLWIVRYYGEEPETMSQLKADNPIYAQFEAYKKGRVLGCNTLLTPFFYDQAFHPDRVLKALREVIEDPTSNNLYFQQLQ